MSTRSRLKIARARTAARVGSERYAWPALNNIDRKMASLLPETGTFLEIGANDGYSQSNTYNLGQHRGWRGILIEPLPTLFALCAKHRSDADCFNVACVGADGPATIRLVDRGLMSVALGLADGQDEARRAGGAQQTVTVPTATMSSLIDKSSINQITFMSVDVEGAELAVLDGLDLARHCPDFLLVETAEPDGIERWAAGHMIRAEQITRHDHLFTKV
jgi:FkbM family methyltransferase